MTLLIAKRAVLAPIIVLPSDLPAPKILFTLRGNTRSEQVIEEMKRLVPSREYTCQINLLILEPNELLKVGESAGVEMVALFDVPASYARQQFTYMYAGMRKVKYKVPSWAECARWRIPLTPLLTTFRHPVQRTMELSVNARIRHCAEQVLFHFSEGNFRTAMEGFRMPWGQLKSSTRGRKAKNYNGHHRGNGGFT